MYTAQHILHYILYMGFFYHYKCVPGLDTLFAQTSCSTAKYMALDMYITRMSRKVLSTQFYL